MQPLIFQDEDDLRRIKTLESNADEILEDYSYERVLTADEVAEEEHKFGETHIELFRLQTELKEFVERMNTQIKAKKKVADAQLQKIKTGREEVKETVYALADQHEQKVGTYNYRGELISERPMRAKERQHRMRFSTDEYSVSVKTADGTYKEV